MENASKALIIAGAILLSILIIAIGMFIYNSAQSTINDSLTSMSSQEKNAFNSNFTGYAGSQTGSQVKSLIGDLITNADTYKEEPAKIICLNSNHLGANGLNCLNAAAPSTANDTQPYVTALGKMRNAIENKHTYWLEIVYNTSGLVDTINIYYEKADMDTSEMAANVLNRYESSNT